MPRCSISYIHHLCACITVRACNVTVMITQHVHCCLHGCLLTMVTACGGVYTRQQGLIRTPTYPSDYAHNSNCTWSITVNSSNIVALKSVVHTHLFRAGYTESLNIDARFHFPLLNDSSSCVKSTMWTVNKEDKLCISLLFSGDIFR